MARDHQFETHLRLNQGIHQQPNFASMDHCSDCRNVWAPNGEVVSRPGSRPRMLKAMSQGMTPGTPTELVLHYDTGSAITTAVSGSDKLTITTLAAGHYIYAGIDASDISTRWTGFSYIADVVNANDITFAWQYYDGTSWKSLLVSRFDEDSLNCTQVFCGGTSGDERRIVFLAPTDIAEYTLTDSSSNSYTKLYVRGRVLSGSASAGRMDISTASEISYFQLDTSSTNRIVHFATVEEPRDNVLFLSWTNGDSARVMSVNGLDDTRPSPELANLAAMSAVCNGNTAWNSQKKELSLGGLDEIQKVDCSPRWRSNGYQRSSVYSRVDSSAHKETIQIVGVNVFDYLYPDQTDSMSETLTLPLIPGNVLLVCMYGDDDYGNPTWLASASAKTFEIGGVDILSDPYMRCSTSITPVDYQDVGYYSFFIPEGMSDKSFLLESYGVNCSVVLAIYEISGVAPDPDRSGVRADDDYSSVGTAIAVGPPQTFPAPAGAPIDVRAGGIVVMLLTRHINDNGVFTPLDSRVEAIYSIKQSRHTGGTNYFSVHVLSGVEADETFNPQWHFIGSLGGVADGQMWAVSFNPTTVTVTPATTEGQKAQIVPPGELNPDAASYSGYSLTKDPYSPYYEGYLAQLKDYPDGHYVTTYKDHTFICGFPESPRLVRWSMANPGQDIFAELGFTYIGGADADSLTGFIKFGENLLVAEPTNIWRLNFQDLDAFGVPHWEPAQLLSGVGCPNTLTAKETRVGLVFLSENGLICYNGGVPRFVSEQRTRGQKVDRLADFWRRVNWSKAKCIARAVDWATKNCYLLALPIDGATVNNIVLVWDYNNNTLWFWDGLDVQGFASVDAENGGQYILFADQNRVIHELTNDNTDNSTGIDCYVTTQRFNQGSARTLKLRETKVTSENTKSNVTLEYFVGDGTTAKTFTCDVTNTLDGSRIDSSDSNDYVITERERTVLKQTRLTGERFRLKLSNATAGREFLIRDVFIRGIPIGWR